MYGLIVNGRLMFTAPSGQALKWDAAEIRDTGKQAEVVRLAASLGRSFVSGDQEPVPVKIIGRWNRKLAVAA